jgi:hypothetical protein
MLKSTSIIININNFINVPIVKIFKNTNLQDVEQLFFKVPLYFGKIL